MKLFHRMLLLLGCVGLISISWFLAVTAKTDVQRQLELMEESSAYMEDGIYINAVTLLEEAVSYNTSRTFEAENMLKETYLNLLPKTGYASKYIELLEKQMDRKDVPAEVFKEAADYYLERSYLSEALPILRRGIERTGDEELLSYYESLRYDCYKSGSVYQEASEFLNGYSMVKNSDGWGLASQTGGRLIPCRYDQISSYDSGRIIVNDKGVISAIDANQNRVALLHEECSDFTGYAEDRLWLKSDRGWRLTDNTFVSSSVYMEDVGMFSNGLCPAKIDGMWGLVGLSGNNWVLPAQYDGIIQDELGRAYAQNAVFVRNGDNVTLLVRDAEKGEFQELPGRYEDAKPFTNGWGLVTDCWAAVKKDGLWGFIDADGNEKIEYQFEDACSFSGHLAAVKTEDGWGYIDLRGDIVINPEYLEAKKFDDGSAPVLTEEGWLFLILTEYGG